MNHYRKYCSGVVMFTLLAAVAYATPPRAEKPAGKDVQALQDEPVDPSMLIQGDPVFHLLNFTKVMSTGFESADGWDLDVSICGAEFVATCNPATVTNACAPKDHVTSQNCCRFDPNEDTGWHMTATMRHCNEPAIRSIHPKSGMQHLRFAYDPMGGAPQGCQTSNGTAAACRQRVATAIDREPGNQELGMQTVYSYEIAFSNTLNNLRMPNFGGVDNFGLGTIYLDSFLLWWYTGQVYLYTVDDGFSYAQPFAYWKYDSPDYAKVTINIDRCNNEVTYTYEGKPNMIHPSGVSVVTEAYKPVFTPPYGDFRGPDGHWPIIDNMHFNKNHFNDGLFVDVDNFVVTHTPCPDACCDGDTGVCTEALSQSECDALPNGRYYPNVQCAQLGEEGYPPGCDRDKGSCCDSGPSAGNDPGPDGDCTDGVYEADCAGPQKTWTRGAACEEFSTLCNVGGGYCSPTLGQPSTQTAFCVTQPGYVPCAADTDCDVAGFCYNGLCSQAVCGNPSTGAPSATPCSSDADCVIVPFTACFTYVCNADGDCPMGAGTCANPGVSPGGRLCTSHDQCVVSAAPVCLETTGACCDLITGECADGVLSADCPLGTPGTLDQHAWSKGVLCADAGCSADIGACCDGDTFGSCTDTTYANCQCDKCAWDKLATCDTLDPPCTHEAIPTVSEWGLVVLTLLLLTGAKVYFGRRQTATA